MGAAARYVSFMNKIELSYSPNCVCSKIQTPKHILSCRRIAIRGNIKTVDDDFRMWLHEKSTLDIYLFTTLFDVHTHIYIISAHAL